jgi:hypothetical protein
MISFSGGKRPKRCIHKSSGLFDIYQILVVDWDMTSWVLHPRISMLIDPHIMRFKTKLKKDLSPMIGDGSFWGWGLLMICLI